MADLTVFPIPLIPNGYNKLGKKLMIHDLSQPESTSTKLINFENILSTSVTYSELTNLITNNLLIEGGFYLLTDFVTIYDQPDYDVNGNPKPIVVTKTAPNIEKIWVLALSSNQIADRAYSATFPKDQIKYDWTYNTTEINLSPAKGRISERIDDKGNRTDYDHREILFKRYDDGTGLFNQWKDNGNASQEFLTFSSGSSNNYIGDFKQYGVFLGINFYLSNNIFTQTALQNKLGLLNINNTFTINTMVSTYLGDANKDILIKGSGVLLKSSLGNQNQNIIITDGEFEIGNNNTSIVLNSNNTDFNFHKIGNQCSNINVGTNGCIQVEDNSSDINIEDNGCLIAFTANTVTILNRSIILAPNAFLNNVNVGNTSDIIGDGIWINVNIGNNSDENQFYGVCENITLGNGGGRCRFRDVNTVDVSNSSVIYISESVNITLGLNNGGNGIIHVNKSSNITMGDNNDNIIFENVVPINGANLTVIGNNNENCKFYGEFIRFSDGGVNDLSNMKNANFSFMDDTGWTNGINPTNTPEIYLDNSEKWIFKGNGNFYEKHFNGSTDVFTLL